MTKNSILAIKEFKEQIVKDIGRDEIIDSIKKGILENIKGFK